MRLGHEHVVDKQRAVEVGFHCRSCRYASQAMVNASGRGRGQSLLVLDEAGARERAAGQADEEARIEAAKIIELAPCPACGKRKAYAVAAFGTGSSRRPRCLRFLSAHRYDVRTSILWGWSSPSAKP
jgi:hypothetical protein